MNISDEVLFLEEAFDVLNEVWFEYSCYKSGSHCVYGV